jgi:hypothetical protein
LSLEEVSGGVPARDFPGSFWALEDGGNPAALYLVDFATGGIRAALNLPGATNTDWEDLASDGTFLYLADIGDNQAERGSVRIYRIPEPTSAQLSFTPGDTLNWTPSELQMRRFVYPDGPRDAESLVAVPFSDDVLVITLNPFVREEAPKSPGEIMDRLNEITFNAALSAELRAVAFVQKLLDEGMLKETARGRYRRLRMHAITADGHLSDLSMASKFATDWAFLTGLRDRGRKAADAWLAAHLKSVGVESTVDLRAEFL